jgi:predicted transcriptional regulator
VYYGDKMSNLYEHTEEELEKIEIKIPAILLRSAITRKTFFLVCYIKYLEQQYGEAKTTTSKISEEVNMSWKNVNYCLYCLNTQGVISILPYHPNGIFDYDEELTIKTAI